MIWHRVIFAWHLFPKRMDGRTDGRIKEPRWIANGSGRLKERKTYGEKRREEIVHDTLFACLLIWATLIIISVPPLFSSSPPFPLTTFLVVSLDLWRQNGELIYKMVDSYRETRRSTCGDRCENCWVGGGDAREEEERECEGGGGKRSYLTYK